MPNQHVGLNVDESIQLDCRPMGLLHEEQDSPDFREKQCPCFQESSELARKHLTKPPGAGGYAGITTGRFISLKNGLFKG